MYPNNQACLKQLFSLYHRSEQKTESHRVHANLVLLHHLPDPTALLADDVAMQLVRHFDVLRYGHQRLWEEGVTR